MNRALCLGFAVMDLRPFRVFEGTGAQEALRVVAPRLRPPSHGTMRAMLAKLEAEHDEKLKGRVAQLSGPAGFTLAVGEIDIWTSPLGESFLGFFVHGLTPAFEPVRLLAYSDAMRTSHTAQNQAQRLIHACAQRVGIDVADLLWAIQTDNTPSAYNVADCLQLQSLRCVAHILALGPRHQLHPVKRQAGGQVRASPSDRASKANAKWRIRAVRVQSDGIRRAGPSIPGTAMRF